jgi:hypothetical protein
MGLKLRVNIAPKDGYIFKETDGSMHRASSWAALVKKVVRYRLLNGRAAGDPLGEITLQACARDSANCYNDDPVTRNETKKASLKGRVLAWFSEIRKAKKADKLLFTDGGVMTARASICAECPMNTQLPGGCSSCRKVVKEFRKEVIGDRGQDGRVHACSLLGTDIATAAWLDEPQLDGVPDNCWRKRK